MPYLRTSMSSNICKYVQCTYIYAAVTLCILFLDCNYMKSNQVGFFSRNITYVLYCLWSFIRNAHWTDWTRRHIVDMLQFQVKKSIEI